MEFGGRPPELFSGIARDEAPMPVSYPSSCAPQAWSSAAILLLVRTMLDLQPDPAAHTLRVGRDDVGTVADMRIERLQFAGRRFDVEVSRGGATVRPSESPVRPPRRG
jgi:glycogen debranching enzyme